MLSTGEQSRATEQIEYDDLGRKTKWCYSGTDGDYGMTYRYDNKPFAVGADRRGIYTLFLLNDDGTSSWTIDVGDGELEIDVDGFLTHISAAGGASFEFEYSSSAENGTE